MNIEEEKSKLQPCIDEARRLRDRNNGVHDMHGSCAGIEGWWMVLEHGGTIDWNNVNILLERMRVCDKTGQYPKVHRPARKPKP